MAPKPPEKKISSTQAIYELLICLMIVMLGGTRVLDYSAYEDTDRLVRAVLIWNADQSSPAAIAKEGCGERWIEVTDGVSSRHQVYRIPASDNCGSQVATPFWMTNVSPMTLNTAALAKQLMPLEYKAQELLSISEQLTTISTQEQQIVTWQVEVPSPPPRTAQARA